MSQTTDQARGRAAGSSLGKKPRNKGKSTGSAYRPAVPSPPKRRRPALTALAVLLIVGGAALAGLLAIRMDSRAPVLVVNTKVSTGERITAAMLSTTNISGDNINSIPTEQADQIINKLYARQTIYPGPAAPGRPAAQEPSARGRPGPGRRTPDVGDVPARAAQRRRRTPRPHR